MNESESEKMKSQSLNEVVMCWNSDIPIAAISTLFYYCLQHPFLYTLVIFMKFFTCLIILVRSFNDQGASLSECWASFSGSMYLIIKYWNK